MRISNTLEAGVCVEALNEAILHFGPPQIMNTDQGSQFTSFSWTDRLRRIGVRFGDTPPRHLPPEFCFAAGTPVLMADGPETWLSAIR